MSVLNRISCASIALGLALIVASDGSPFWRAARSLIVLAVCVAVAFASRVGNRRLGNVSLVVLGVLAAAVGAAIGPAYATTIGFSAPTLGGALALIGGLAALLAGVVGLVRAARGWRRLGVIAVVVLVGYVGAVPVSVAVYATNVPRPSVGSITPADRGLRFVNASFVTRDGVRLSGWYIPSRNRAAVVLLHGSSSTRSNTLAQAVVLARHGYGVLLYDARGHGRSGGRAMDFGWYGDLDVAAAVDYLQTRPDVSGARIGAVGLSMGGEEVIGAMAHDDRIKASVAEGATNRTFADKGWLTGAYGVRGQAQRVIDWLTYTLTDAFTAAHPPISLRRAVAAAAPRPLLLIAAGNEPDEARADEWIRAGSPKSVEIWVVPGANHTGGLRVRPAEWTRRVIAFFDRTLLGR